MIVLIFIFIIIHGRNTTFFVESSDGDIRKLVDQITRSQQPRPFVTRSTLAFCERFKYDMKINGRVVK